MLAKLTINDMIIIDSLNISIHQGLTGFTGETGAGKTLLFDALELALGGPSNHDLIRTGEDQASIEVIFHLESDTKSFLAREVKNFEKKNKLSLGISIQKKLVLRHILKRNENSISYMNDVEVSKELLNKIAPYLLDFSRQFDQSELLRPVHYRSILDRYAKLDKKVSEIAYQLQIVRALRKEYRASKILVKNSETIQKKLEEEITYLAEICPSKNEYDKLQKQREKLANNIDALDMVAEICVRMLGENIPSAMRNRIKNTGNSLSCYDVLSRNANQMGRLRDAHVYPRSRIFTKQLYRMAEQIEGMVDDLKDFYYQNSTARERLAEIQERIEILEDGIQKYGSWDKFYSRSSEIEQERKKLEIAQKRFESLPQQLVSEEEKLLKMAKEVEYLRKTVSIQLSEEIRKQLLELAMDNAKFQITVDPLKEYDESYTLYPDENTDEEYHVDSTGGNRVIFWFSANVGEPLRPLHEVASGGELSRILLALKYVLAQQLHIHTFIFDEIDTGVSGKANTLLAKKLREMADNHFQILMITHTAPVAAVADQHFFVSKKITEKGRTETDIALLDIRQRVQELARIAVGDTKSSTALNLGKELMEIPKNFSLNDIPKGITDRKEWKKYLSNIRAEKPTIKKCKQA